MENCNCKETEVKLVGKTKILFFAGLAMSVICAALFFIGTYGAARDAMWISAVAIGGIGLIITAITAHSTNGWYRMFSIVFMELIVVLGTIMIMSVV